jgi:hypothetical protein
MVEGKNREERWVLHIFGRFHAMKRCMLAMAALIVLNCGVASADYILIRIDLNQLLDPTTSPLSPNQPVLTPKGGFGGAGPGGAGGFGGGFQGKGGKGAKGFPPNQGLFPGQQGNMPPGQGGAQQPAAPAQPPLYVYAYLEVKAQPLPIFPPDKFTPFAIYDVKLGSSKDKKEKAVEVWIPQPALSTNALAFQNGQGNLDLIFSRKSISTRFAERVRDELKEGNDVAKKKKLHELAEWALIRGLVPQFNNMIDELKKLDPKDATVAAVAKVREQLAALPSGDDPASKDFVNELRKKEPSFKPIVSNEGHYTLVTNMQVTPIYEAELKKKLSKLEDVYSVFFYWSALKGTPRTPPPYRLIAVMVDIPNNPKAFQAKHEQYNLAPLVGSGFTAQYENLAVLASRRMDEAYEKLSEFNQSKWEEYGMTQSELLDNVRGFMGNQSFQTAMQNANKSASAIPVLAVMQSLALCQKSMNDEAETLALTHGGMRQLIAATGVMPRNVDTAEWARFGLASLFEISDHSFYSTPGGSNWAHLVEFKALRQIKLLEKKDAKDILDKTITDEYFRLAERTKHLADLIKDDQAQLRQKAKDDLEMARATAWSLMHYLAEKKHRHLERYFEELRNLPRDLPYDSKVLRDCFYRAFDLLREDPNDASRRIPDVAKLDNLALDWFNVTDKTYLDLNDYDRLAVNWRVDALKITHPALAQAKNQPGQPNPLAPGAQPALGVDPVTGDPLPPGKLPPIPKKGGKGGGR